VPLAIPQSIRRLARMERGKLRARAGRVGQRPQQVEEGAHFEIEPHPISVFHGRVHVRSEQNPIPTSRMHEPIRPAEVRSRSHRFEQVCAAAAAAIADRPLPCFATWTPAPATTNAATVEMLNVPAQSPPVPHVSSRV